MSKAWVGVLASVALMFVAGCEGGGDPAQQQATPEANVAGAPAPPADTGGRSQDTSRPAGFDALTWDLSLRRPDEVQGPRMAELLLRHGDGLRFVRSEALTAASRAGKDVVVQERAGGRLRVLVFSGGNTQRLDTGPLVRLTFERTGGGGGEDGLEVLYDQSAFAPAALYPRPETVALTPVPVPATAQEVGP